MTRRFASAMLVGEDRDVGLLQPGGGKDIDDLAGNECLRDDLADRLVEHLGRFSIIRDVLDQRGADGLKEPDCDRFVKGEGAFSCVAALQRVVGVRYIAEVFLALQRIEVEFRRVGQKVLVAGGIDHEFRHRQPAAIGERVFDTRAGSPSSN